MSKGNPIVGLAHVVVSQQEMLEKAYEQIEELKQELDDLDRIKSQSWRTCIRTSKKQARKERKPRNYQEFMREAKFKKREEFCRCRYSLKNVKILHVTDKYYKMYPPRSMHQHLIKAMLAGVRI